MGEKGKEEWVRNAEIMLTHIEQIGVGCEVAMVSLTLIIEGTSVRVTPRVAADAALLHRLMTVARATSWKDLPEKKVRVRGGSDGISAVGDLDNDDWVELVSNVRRCIVKDCANTSDLGAFNGPVCMPCSRFLSSGDRSHAESQSYRNHLEFARQAWGEIFTAHFSSSRGG